MTLLYSCMMLFVFKSCGFDQGGTFKHDATNSLTWHTHQTKSWFPEKLTTCTSTCLLRKKEMSFRKLKYHTSFLDLDANINALLSRLKDNEN